VLSGGGRESRLSFDPRLVERGGVSVPILFFILLVILIAQIGFWKTLAAVIGALGMMVLLVVLVIAAVAVGGMVIASRMRH
jgi:hypothetical protein